MSNFLDAYDEAVAAENEAVTCLSCIHSRAKWNEDNQTLDVVCALTGKLVDDPCGSFVVRVDVMSDIDDAS